MQTCFTKERRRRNAMQCELVTWEKHRGRILFFPCYNAKKRFFFVFYVHFLQCNLFFFFPCTFATMQTCYMEKKKKHTYFFFFCYNTKKKFFSSYCIFFGFFFSTIFLFFVACNCLVTWNKKKKHACASFLCYNISYVIYFLLYFSLIPLLFWL